MRTICAAVILLSSVLPAFAQLDAHWNATPNDINNWLKSMKGKMDADYTMEVKSMAEISVNPEQNPILYRSGHYNFTYTRKEREKLREYLLAGGMIVYNVGLGSMPFYRSVKRELEQIFPEQPLQRLGSDHPIFHSFHDVDRVEYCDGVRKAGFKGNEPWFDGIEINCRVVALVSRWGLAVGWEGDVQEDFQAYRPESAYKLGVNIFSYASAMRAWAQNAAQSMKFVDKDAGTTDKVTMAQVVYDGVWRTRHAGLSVLLQTFNRKTDIPVKFGLRELRLSDADIFNAPVLYLTGHEYFELNGKEMTMLREYLASGGFLFAEACCGRKGFDLALRKIMKQVFPQHPLQRIDPNGSIFRVPNDIRAVGVTPTFAADVGRNATIPRLEGIDMDGHFAVIYSPLGLAGGWEMSQSPYARGCNAAGSLQIGQNVLMYAVTQ